MFLTNGKGDDYDKLQISIENRNLLFSKERMVYVESMVLFEKEKETWWYGMEERYIESLQLSFKDEKYLKKQLCLCTMIDMGEIGCFNRKFSKDYGNTNTNCFKTLNSFQCFFVFFKLFYLFVYYFTSA